MLFQRALKAVGQGRRLTDESPAAYAAYVLAQRELGHVEMLFQKLSTSDAKWMKDFLEAEGLENIYTMLH